VAGDNGAADIVVEMWLKFSVSVFSCIFRGGS
jgi:hypothetical protein